MDASQEELEDDITHVVPRKPFLPYIDETVFLEVKSLLGQHPDKVFSLWARENPRLFLLLRMLGCDDDALYQKLDSENIGDFWLPLGPPTLHQLESLTSISAQDWLSVQRHVLSSSDQMSEQKLISPTNAHRHIRDGSAHFEEVEKIGKGGSAEVTRVRHTLSGREFACKRIQRANDVKTQRNQLIEFTAEVNVLKRANHHHLVSFVASFTDLASFSLILNPVAKDVLKSVLERQSRDQPLPGSEISTLRRSFGCLATALAYLHDDEGVRHKDIKPGNILLSNGQVFLCDFGISRDWSKADNSTTEGEVMRFTRRYCAPEVFERDPRNTKSDVWSLGCVFLEMISVVKGYPMEEMNAFLLEHSAGASRSQGLFCASDAMNAWLVKIRSEKNDSADDIPLKWIKTMIRPERDERVKASELVEMICTAPSELSRPGLYIGSCCTRPYSVGPVNAVDSPTLPVDGLGIHNAHASPPITNLLTLPRRYSNSSSRGRRSITPPSQGRGAGDRSSSPHILGANPRDNTETGPFQMDPISTFPSTGTLTSKSLRRKASPCDSLQASSPCSQPRADSAAASSSTFPPRYPVPPPDSINVKCSCAAQAREKHIFNISYATTQGSVQFDSAIPTIETCPVCEMSENKIQIYETLPRDPTNTSNSVMPKLWWSTRRLVISYLSGQPPMRHCSSFWLPLADIRSQLIGNAVTLQWSDCNQMTKQEARNYATEWNWLYNPKRTNNSITLEFNTADDAQRFANIVTQPYEDGETVSGGPSINVSGNTELNIFDVGRPGVRNYRVATLNFVKDSLVTSKLFIQWPEADLDIRIRDSFDDRSAATPGYEMVVEMRNVTTPTYYSDTRGEPAADRDRVARFSSAHQVKTSLAVAFQIGLKHGLPRPPNGVTKMLQGLTGWTLCYFAIVTKFKAKNKRFGSKKYGKADVLLWEKEVDDSTTAMKRRGAKVTFRLHEADSLGFLWTSGSITDSTSISTSTSQDATISVSNKTRGKLLDVSRMIAIASETANSSGTGHARGISDAHEDLSDLVLTFENEHYRLEFVKLVTRFKVDAAAAAPLSRTVTSADSMRRMSSLASADVHMSPPMR